ncbi:uncharacterized protein C8Q71DRAFT_756197 [Rhodofomes roseus]|uniref:Hemimethylated DNA-binding domain-containing protein n=1 Tax=Rhodofomes roseus TaxID=34475 RepID=A0ABQ8KGG8_9APHY|nr:uncharacterized protein C8Q71DRAFT_756197 [Rhodofomes roseus]KAH9836946.1 hypothetical protein C8Q71DRAFT_756197 [Rhodofomes roseus]
MQRHWPWLPTELYADVLRFLPPDDDFADTSVKTLVNCLGAHSQLRVAALQPSVWKHHYCARYTECVEEREAQRREKTKGDYRRMYIARRKLDRRALEAVDEIRLQLSGRHARAAAFVKEFSFDVWNALEREAQLPVPAYLLSGNDGGYLDEDVDMDAHVDDIPHVLPRRYWAKAMMGVVARHHTLQKWASLYSAEEEEHSVTFEDALAGLSAFYDQSPKHISSWLGMLAHDCRVQLTAGGIELDPVSPDYDLPSLVVRLRETLRGMGFCIAEGDDFYNPLNQFPHAFMRTESRKTIPMGLVYVYTSVARKLGIRASPTNYPGKVLCHIDPIDPEQNEMLFDVCGQSQPLIFTSRDLRQMLVDIGLRPDMPAEIIRPCKVGTILHRAAANTIIAVRWNQRRAAGSLTENHAWCSYAAFCISLLQSQDNQALSQNMDSKPLDALAVLNDVVCPALNPPAREILAKHCEKLVETDEEFARTVWPRTGERSVMYFVGLIVQHKKYEYAGCIIGWHPMCLAKEDLSPVMEVQRLTRGWNQPFYWVVSVDGSKRYAAEEDLYPVDVRPDVIRRMFVNRSIFGRFFEGVHLDNAHKRGRLLPTQELQTLFPEDDQVGCSWVRRGTLGNRKLSFDTPSTH